MIQNRESLKEAFESKKFPNGQDYSNLIDSYVHKTDRYSTQADLIEYEGVEGEIAQHVGKSTETLVNGYFYKKSNGQWQRINVQPTKITEEIGDISKAVEETQKDIKEIKFNIATNQLSAGEAVSISEKKISVNYDKETLTTINNNLTIKRPIQVDLNSYLGGKQGDIVQHIGNDENGYVNGYFYQCESDGEITDVPNHFWLDTFGIKLEGEYVRTAEMIENFEQDISIGAKKIIFDRVWKVQQVSTGEYYYAAVFNAKDFDGAGDFLAFWIIELNHNIILKAPVDNGPVRASKWVRIDVQPTNYVNGIDVNNALSLKLDKSFIRIMNFHEYDPNEEIAEDCVILVTEDEPINS